MASKTIDQVLELQRKRQQKALEAFTKLVETLAAGKRSPSAEAIDETLSAAGKTVDDLEREIGYERERIECRAKIQRAEELEGEKAGIDEQIQAAKQKLDEAREAYSHATAPLFARKEAISEAVYQSGLAQIRLSELMPEDTRQQVLTLRRELNDVAERLKHTRKDREQLMTGDPARQPKLQGDQAAKRAFAEKLQRADERVAAVQDEHDKLNNRIEQLTKQATA